MKRKCILMGINCIILASLLCGCNKVDVKGILKNMISEWEEEDDEYIFIPRDDVGKKGEKMSKQVYEAIKSRNSEELKALFAPYTAENYDLDKEIADFFKKIDGNIIGVEEIWAYFDKGATQEMKGDVFNRYFGTLENVKTDTGCSYCVSIIGIYNYEGSDEKVGLNVVYLNGSAHEYSDHLLAKIGDVAQYYFEHFE